MDFPKRVAPQGSPGRNPKEMAPRAMEADENATPRRSVPARSASPQRKKVLGERNGAGSGGSLGEGASAQHKVAPTPPSLAEGRAGAYDPKTNCTTPRPDFLRYDPKRSAEILLRLEREAEDCSSVTSGTEISEAVCSGSSARESDSECDDADEEEEMLPAQGGSWARRLPLLLLSAACLLCYIYCMSSNPFPATSEEPQNFVGWNGSMNDVGVHEVFSLLGPIGMMGLEDEPEADMGHIVHRDSEDGSLLHGPGASPGKFMAVAMVGMADYCPNVPFGEFSCQVGDESSEIVDVLKEDSELGKLKSEEIMGSFEKADESSEVACSGGDAIGDSFGSSHSLDMEEDKLGLVHQEKREDDSEHTTEKTMESESVMLENEDKGLESVKLDKEFDSWEYENTAGAAKELVHMVKNFWSAVKPHLLKMLACLSIAGFVAAIVKYSQRSRKINVPVSRRVYSAPPMRVPILAPHNTAKLPVLHSEQPVQRTMPRQELASCFELPVQSLLTKPDPSVSVNVPSVASLNGPSVQQRDAGIVRASDVMDHKDIDKSKPPVVQLLGEFSFMDSGSSRGRSVKGSNQHGGDITVQESLPLRKDVVKMQKESDKSPGVQAAAKKKSAAEEEGVEAMPTPLRCSNRLRKKVTP